ncbi:NAD-dependent epimerase/dehydratase family protein [Paenibacillus beijingensis]|uniref:NAD-dependent dehydratase n=1 Tax=Paenibacillus beijingensis TaxID=1126833 RepID=A0A0D5NKE6_9BACL|nr:NAD-dependent epimerase/dehydratase family protein [Paenibacillus beijingensis]AJY75403.1 NAD-dependent dehydratase [Paenibacillus beijingensis]
MHVILGTGPLGLAVMREIEKRGEPFRFVNVSGTLPKGINAPLRRADLMDAEQAREAARGATVIYHCVQPPYHRWDGLFERLQDNIISAAAANGAKLAVAENLYMYGEVNGSIHERLPYKAATRKGQIRAKLTRRLQELYRTGDLQAVIGRGADFFGPYVTDSSVGERLFKPLINGKHATVMGDPDKKHTYTFIDDFGKALVMLGEAEDAYGQAWHVPNADTVTTRQFVGMAAQAAGCGAKVRTMGIGMLRFGGLFIPAARESIEMFYQYERDFVVDSWKFSDRFKMAATPLADSLAATIDWYRSRYQAIQE